MPLEIDATLRLDTRRNTLSLKGCCYGMPFLKSSRGDRTIGAIYIVAPSISGDDGSS